jgi:hypothetical protein
MEEDQPKLAKGRKVAILVAAGAAVDEIRAMQSALVTENVLSESSVRVSGRSRERVESLKPRRPGRMKPGHETG